MIGSENLSEIVGFLGYGFAIGAYAGAVAYILALVVNTFYQIVNKG